jgi:predicted SAM-dependent methyltransferase
VRDFPQKVTVEDVKSMRDFTKLKVQVVKKKLSCEESGSCENEAFVRDFVKVEDVKTKLSCEASLKM